MIKVKFIFFMLYSIIVFSQNNLIDSLKIVIKNNQSINYNDYRDLSLMYLKSGDKAKAITTTLEAIRHANKTDNDSIKAYLQMDLGYFYNNEGIYDKAIKHTLNALNYFEQFNDTINMVNCYMDASYVYNKIENFNDALDLLNRALALAKEKNIYKQIPMIYNSIGIAYNNSGDNKLALENYEKSFTSIKEYDLNYTRLAISLHNNIAILETKEGAYDQALSELNEAILMAKQLNYKDHLSVLYFIKANVYRHLNIPDSELVNINLSIKNGSNAPLNKTYANAIKSLSKFYEKHNDILKSYEYLNQYITVIDSLNLKEKAKSILKAKTLYKIKKKEIEINNLEFQNNLANEKLKSYKYKIIFFISFSILITILFLGFLFFRFKINKAYNVIVKNSVKEINYKKEITKLTQEDANEIVLKENSKYLNSSLNINERKRIIKQINNVLLKDNIYLDANISLDKFVEAVKTNKTYLSQVLKEDFNTNYTDLINEYRIEKAKELLVSNYALSYTINSIAIEVGYNSVATFYRAFKKHTGVTPTFFIDNLNKLI